MIIECTVQFFRLFLGLFGNGFPEVMVNNRNETFFRSTRVHANKRCTSVAMAFENGNYTVTASPNNGTTRLTPLGVPPETTYLVFRNTTLWFSNVTVDSDDVSVVIAAAEESLGEGWALLEALSLIHI